MSEERAQGPAETETAQDAADGRRPRQGVPGVDLPLCDRDEFDSMLADMAAQQAPRRFAVVQEYGDRLDARIAAWGMGFEDHAELVSVDGDQLTLAAAENAPPYFARPPKISASVLWLDPVGEQEQPE